MKAHGILLVASLASGSAHAAEGVSLAQALDLARQRYEQYQLVAEQRLQIELLRDRAWAALLPNVSAAGTFTLKDREISVSSRAIQRIDTFAGRGTASLDLFRGPAIPTLLAAYDRAAGAAEQNRWQRNALDFEVATTFFAALAADSLVEAKGRTLSVASEQLAAARQRLAAGMGLALDETRFQLEVVSAQEALTRAENTRATTHELLAFYLGDDRPHTLLAPPAVRVPEASPEALTGQALEKRPDLKAAAHAVDAAETAVTGAWMDYLPSLSVQGSFVASQNTGWSGEPLSGEMLVTLNWVLFDGGLRCAERRGRDSELRVARLEQALLARSVRRDVRQAGRDLLAARATVLTAGERQRLARETAAAVRRRYDAGLATSLDVTEADDDLNQADHNVVIEELNLSLAGLALLRALGLDPQGEPIRSDDGQ